MSKSSGFWEFVPKDGDGRPLRLCARYLRMAHTSHAPDDDDDDPTMSYLPGTFVLASQECGPGRKVFFTYLSGFTTDGLWLPRARRVDDRSVVVDAATLGPRGSLKRKVSRADRRQFRKWCATLRSDWQEWGQSANVETYRSRWQSFLDRFRGPFNPAAIVYQSEVGGPEVNYFRFVPYCRVALFHPKVPNHIRPNSFGDSREIVGFIPICPRIQADAGFLKWTQRVFYVDHATGGEFLEGHSPCSDYSPYVDFRTSRPGVPSRDFDGRDLPPIDEIRLGEYRTIRKQWLTRYQPNRS